MKLKKIVSLALAGIMAVSMLAGCNFDGAASSNGGASSEAPVATGMTGKVIAALNEDLKDKVTFDTNASLQNTLEILLANTKKDSLNSIDGNALVSLNSILGSKDKLPKLTAAGSVSSGSPDASKQTYVFTKSVTGTVDEEFLVNQLVAAIEKEEVTLDDDNKTMATMAQKSNADKASASDATYHYEFKYTASVATVSTVDSNGQTTYIAAVALTRTPTKVVYAEVEG